MRKSFAERWQEGSMTMKTNTATDSEEVYDLEALGYPLPESVKRCRQTGNFELEEQIIREKLADSRTPECLKKRLYLEREIIKRLPAYYPYDRGQALSMLKMQVRDFQERELDELIAKDAVEWQYINGNMHFHVQFLENLMKVYREYRNRDLQQSGEPDRNRELLCENMLRMKSDICRRVHIHLRATMRLTEAGKEKCRGRHIRVYLPLPVEYAQVHNYRLHAVSPHPVMVAGPEYPQRTAVFEADLYENARMICASAESGKAESRKMESGEGKLLTEAAEFSAEFSFDNVMEYCEPQPEQVLPQQPTFYTEEQAPHIRFTPYIRALVQEIVGGETNPLLKVRRIYDYITTHVCYSFVRAYSTFENIPEFVASSLKGDCGFQALLFITLCRCAGVPARWQSGLYATPYQVGSHDWAQYYIAPYGWLYADCSFGGSAYRQGDEARRVFYGANLDPYRIPQASEFQHGFIIPEGALRFDPYDNQAGEIICGGEALSAYGADFETVYDMIEMNEIY